LFPVPATDVITINAKDPIRELQILNSAGQIISTSSVNASMTNVDVQALNAGVYMARVIMQDGTIGRRPFVKN
jgi:hypothetical protein